MNAPSLPAAEFRRSRKSALLVSAAAILPVAIAGGTAIYQHMVGATVLTPAVIIAICAVFALAVGVALWFLLDRAVILRIDVRGIDLPRKDKTYAWSHIRGVTFHSRKQEQAVVLSLVPAQAAAHRMGALERAAQYLLTGKIAGDVVISVSGLEGGRAAAEAAIRARAPATVAIR